MRTGSSQRRLLAQAVLIGFLGLGCQPRASGDVGRSNAALGGGGERPVSSQEKSPAPAPLASASTLPPLQAEARQVDLEVPGHHKARLVVPLGATQPKPVVVVLHGNFDRPEWQCDVWQTIIREDGFVLCTRGLPSLGAPPELDRWRYGPVSLTEKEILAALAALRVRFDGYVAEGAGIYAGFSQGAIRGVQILPKNPSLFRAAVLVEGGYDGWTRAKATEYATQSGKRILFACGQSHCNNASRVAAAILEQSGVTVRVVSAGNVGHTYDGLMAEAVSQQWPWVLGRESPTE